MEMKNPLHHFLESEEKEQKYQWKDGLKAILAQEEKGTLGFFPLSLIHYYLLIILTIFVIHYLHL